MIVYFHKNFEKQFAKLPQKIRAQFKKRRDVFLSDPYDPLLNNHALQGPLEGYRSINVTGDFRAIYKHLAEKAVEFVDIDTHHNLFGS
ncbi:hypothetical protein A3F27_03385 [Candidatus Kaiserbacteria bacterium RIFCSPHIGHO2_12_FULL_53_13]|uniref:Uncharacterized protein n=1 Tax=Candidatus Kaiserbacteria bacterium RIFCSPHIGHO2_12_FULL_53_13 TaxID=1798502 RepID=A0A1F6E5Z9_9BACT|nr:MAG: hypothetical protein A3F27_03385 [Candidatus Kaiserbacteria bacterium RIFCSPHIGHO2_12_FULL_53_13]OGG74380.1 MAG: hypothetical protein A3A37_00230 [Candidatus Kaiserbacteria bacterium RIFCSPLOWO2_01_FULL_52_36]